MSKWMSIGFDPDQMDPVREPNTQAAISGGRDDAAPRQTGGLNSNATERQESPRNGVRRHTRGPGDRD
jgi:hypothetical protein